MLGKIVFIGDNQIRVRLQSNINVMTNLMNIHVVIEDQQKRILGEITSIDGTEIEIGLLGEFVGKTFYSGVIKKPTLTATIRFINQEELAIVIGNRTENSFLLGDSPLYSKYPIYADINQLFSNHFAVFGNTGSGKSCSLAKIIQNLFANTQVPPYRSNFLIFDSYGEYHNAFEKISEINPNFQFKYYTTNESDSVGELLRVPIWTFGVNDLALLLFAKEHSQLTIIEEMIRLANLFAMDSEESKNYKNHLIAKAIISILYSNQTSASKRNDTFKILESCSTDEFHLNVQVQGLGYSRTFRELFTIDSNGNFPERNLLIEYVTKFIREELDDIKVTYDQKYSLSDLENALNFISISQGIIHNAESYNSLSALKVRLHAIIVSEYAKYFDYPEYVTKEQYINSLITKGGRKVQIINFNFEDVDDWFSKSMTKYFCNLIFNYCKSLGNKSNIPFNLLLEEAHRYIQTDNDQYLFGYNIFERIAKEGRKYGVIMGLLSQRPVEISETVISQISNFLIFKMTHPLDVEYIKKMLPNISEDIVEKQKILQSGTCVAFGKAFRIPLLIHFDMPNPAPFSSNCDMVSAWKMS